MVVVCSPPPSTGPARAPRTDADDVRRRYETDRGADVEGRAQEGGGSRKAEGWAEGEAAGGEEEGA